MKQRVVPAFERKMLGLASQPTNSGTGSYRDVTKSVDVDGDGVGLQHNPGIEVSAGDS